MILLGVSLALSFHEVCLHIDRRAVWFLGSYSQLSKTQTEQEVKN
jgi:hypothetical protein